MKYACITTIANKYFGKIKKNTPQINIVVKNLYRLCKFNTI